MTDKPLRAILYSRVSSTNQADNTSHESQYEAGLKWAQSNGALVVRYYRETESGALYLARGELQKALTDLENDDADVLVIYDFSRYSREREAQEVIRKRVARAKKRLAFTTLNFEYDSDTDEMTPESELLFGTMGSVAAYELAQIKRRLVGGQKRRVAEGRQIAGRDPLGYHILKKADWIRGDCTKDEIGTYRIVEAQAPLVKEIFRLYDGGATLDKITRELNMRGQRTPRGNLWRPDGIRDILLNPVYKGAARYGATRRVTDESRLHQGFKTKVVQKPRAPHEIKTIPCPALVEEELWERVSARMAQARARHGGRKDRVFMLSGLLVCPLCGGAMRGKTMRPMPTRPTAHRYYCCENSSHSGHQKRRQGQSYCPQSALRADDTEAAILKELFRIFSDEKLLRETLKIQNQTKSATSQKLSDSEIEQAKRKRAELEKQEADTITAQIRAVASGVDSAPYEKILADLGAQKREIGQFLTEQEKAERKMRDIPKQAAQLCDLLEPARRVMESGDTTAGEKHDLLAMLIQRIEFESGKPRIIFVEL